MAVYFFSDAHLGEADQASEKIKLRRLSAFFDLVERDGERLYILGDLFDFWFEYKYAIPKDNLRVVFRLAAMVESGIAVHYIAGNHDFWLGDFLSREAGLEIHRDRVEVTEQGKRLFLIHGDGLAPGDRGYRILKRILRHPLNIWLYRKLPVDWGIPLARRVARKSRNYTSGRPGDFAPDYENYAAGRIAAGFDGVIIGHLHVPVLKELGGGVYLNTGDFIEHFSYGKLEQGRLTLAYIEGD